MTHKLRSEMSSQNIDTSADIRFESLTLLEGFVILDLNRSKKGEKNNVTIDKTITRSCNILRVFTAKKIFQLIHEFCDYPPYSHQKRRLQVHVRNSLTEAVLMDTNDQRPIAKIRKRITPL